MNFDQLAAGFRNPTENQPCGEVMSENPVGEVTIAGTIVAATKDECCVDINGTQYEIKGSDVIDIVDLNPTDPGKVGEGNTEEEEAAARADRRLALIKLQGNAILHSRIAVPAALVAAAGTWLGIVPATETEKEKEKES